MRLQSIGPIFVVLSNLVAIYPIYWMNKLDYNDELIITILTAIFSWTRDIFEIRPNLQICQFNQDYPFGEDHQRLCTAFKVINIIFTIIATCSGIYLLVLKQFVPIKLILPIIGISCLILGEIIVKVKLFSPEYENYVYSALYSLWHCIAFISLVVVLPENNTWYPILY